MSQAASEIYILEALISAPSHFLKITPPISKMRKELVLATGIYGTSLAFEHLDITLAQDTIKSRLLQAGRLVLYVRSC